MCINVKIMKKTYILIALSAMVMLSGCDFFRKVAGRPTSEDIKAKKTEIARVEELKAEQQREFEREQARLDSIRVAMELQRLAEEKAIQDSLDALETLKNKGFAMHDSNDFKRLSKDNLQHRYYVVVGSFGEMANANRYVKRVSKYPEMEPVKIRLRHNRIAVGVCPRNKVTDLAAVIDDVKVKSFCPKDAWILVNCQ